MITYNFEQRSPEWFAIRRGKLTASEAHTISVAGKGLDTLCIKKASEIALGGNQIESYTNPDIDRGVEFENEARNMYEIQTGNIVKQVGFVMQDEHCWFGASPDGLVGDDGLIEIKCKNEVNHFKRILGYSIEPEYYWQMQMQMLCTGRLWCDYVSYNPFVENTKICIERVYKNQEDIAKLKVGLNKGFELINKYVNTYEERTNESIR